MFNEEIIPILYNLFQRIETEGILRYFPNIKARERHYKNKLETNISHEHRQKIFNKILILANQIQQCIKRIIHYEQVGFITGM